MNYELRNRLPKTLVCSLLLVVYCLLPTDTRAQEPDVFQTIQDGGQVTITQNKQIEDAMRSSIYRNVYKKSKGYRVRIFFDNGKTARDRSTAIATGFKKNYPDVAVYRVFEDLYFKVAVGDFRTKTDAMRFLNEISKSYPSAFIITDQVNLRRGAGFVDATEVVIDTPADSTEVEVKEVIQ